MLPEESGSPTAAGYRIADADRDRVVAVLRTHCTEGRITLDEFSDRVGAVYDARTSADLDAVLHDLQPRFPAHPQAPVRIRARKRWVLAVFGSSAQRGRFRLEDESGALAVFGDCTLDLSEALIDDPSPTINAVAFFGDVTILVPEGIEVDMMGVAVFGDKRCATGDVRPLPGSPVVHVRAMAVFGDVRVRPPRRRG